MPRSQHAELFNLIEYDGPHVSVPVLDRVFPQGFDAHNPDLSRQLRLAYEEWYDAKDDPAIHRLWVEFILHETLKYPDDLVVTGPAIPPGMDVRVAEHGETLRPDYVLVDPKDRPNAGKPRMLIRIVPPDQDLEKPEHGSRWKASPDTRMMMLCKAANVPIGLVTNGEAWMLVYAPPDETTGYTTWYANLWLDEPLTFRAWRSLLGIHRFFGVADADTLEALLAESARNQQEVTDQLGLQVREAVELFVATLDRIDMEQGRKVLADVTPEELYEASLTVMMRLVFLLCAEERGLLLLGDPVYDQFYAVSTLSAQLREMADQHGEEILERRYDAWSRLLATFRAVYAGVQHENLRLTAYGGSLFNPDRFPFIEGRARGTKWRDRGGRPLPVDNRTVLHLMEALQFLQLGGERQRLSFRALGIEQIGHVYEGLLDHTVFRATENDTVVSLTGAKGNEPEVAVSELEAERAKDEQRLVAYLKEKTGRSERAIQNALKYEPDLETQQRLRAACANNEAVLTRVLPFAGLIREDSFGHPVVINGGSFYVTQGSERRKTGTHYTPRSLTEPIVQYTLEPLVYEGPAEGWSKEQWKLRTPKEILALKICDMAMGSGAFLVQTVRYLAERLVEAWEQTEEKVASGEWRVVSNEAQGAGDECRVMGGECRVMSGEAEQASALETVTASILARPSSRRLLGKVAQPIASPDTQQGGISDGGQELPGIGSLASGDGPRGNLLHNNQGIPQGGSVRTDQPDTAGGVHSGQHCGGTGQEFDQGVSEPSQHSAGLVDGIGNAPPAEPARGTTDTRTTGEATGNIRQSKPDADGTKEGAASTNSEQHLICGTHQPPVFTRHPSLASRHSPPATLHSPPATRHPPRITPEGLPATGDPREQIIPADPDERMLYARRIICDRCIYGVDINPLAVEMAKLSLWLITMDKGRAFSFLNHALKCGDSLLGLWDVEQVRKFHLDASVPAQAGLWGDHVHHIFEYALQKRHELESFMVNDVRDSEAKARLLAEADAAMDVVRMLCDMLITAAVTTADGNSQHRGAMLPKGFDTERDRIFDAIMAAISREQIQSAVEAVRSLIPEYLGKLNAGNPNSQNPRRPFHWPVEFPEIFSPDTQHPVPVTNTGFSAFVGNPPFQGGKRITGAIGTDYRDYCVDLIARGAKGCADLCAYFFLRAEQLLRSDGGFGLLATNTIAQGDTREVGLDQLVAQRCVVPRAVSSRKWPGAANLEVAHVWVRKGSWQGGYVLEDRSVSGITPFLVIPGNIAGTPFRLSANANRSFQGSNVLGLGFTLTPHEAHALIDRNPENRDVLYPYLNGEDLNSSYDQSPSRWVINFRDWPLERSATGSWIRADESQRRKYLQEGRVPADYPNPVAADYPDCLVMVEKKVKPERDRLGLKSDASAKGYAKYWWRYARLGSSRDATIAKMERVLATARVSNTLGLAFVRPTIVMSDQIVVAAYSTWGTFGILQSTLHYEWVVTNASTLGRGLRYTPSDCLETFPLSESLAVLNTIAERYYGHRQAVMVARQEGLTTTYNRFHSSVEHADDIQRLRELHAEMDRVVADAYGWTDLHLGHDFRETKQGIRFTVSESARREILDRLLALNHQRYAEEVAQGLHEKKGSTKDKRKRKDDDEDQLF